ncbi:transglutaminase-like domain-containing protein [Niabella ginsengisoli]|uniref:Transglutaminase-like domain-containing protein n=1 Tax=Niabella ginsengisoli TaxID=522298 RepID=A0ABS9SGB3_9BACT|nr:transglutaminase-like domain-containing protein [Niabella ginsengisoli]MCH5597403.1 transglutaminase-like domain-containing protein [Niabella ginsengisoli]
MENEKEVEALLTLIEDPDNEVFEAVSNRIIAYGTPIIANLEDLWENTIDDAVQERIELLIHRLHFINLKNDFQEWNNAAHHELLPGALLVAKLLYPDLHTGKVIQDVERLRRNIWIELNNYLTPLEQVNVITSILYNYFGLKGTDPGKKWPADFLISNVIESKKGNQTGNGVLYLLLCELLDIPVRLIPIPNQFVLAYFKSRTEIDADKLHLNIEFFIDPTIGQVFTHNDLYNYFNRISSAGQPDFFRPQNHKQVIQKLLSDLKQCYDTESKIYMINEIDELITILNN